MAESVSTIGYGDELEWSTDDGGTWTAVNELTACDVPTHSVDKHERTHMKSPSRTKEYTRGLRDVNDVSFSFNFNSPDYEALFALETAGTIAMWRHTLALSDGEETPAKYEYKGFLEIGGGTREVQGVTVVDATIKRTGVASFTAGA